MTISVLLRACSPVGSDLASSVPSSRWAAVRESDKSSSALTNRISQLCPSVLSQRFVDEVLSPLFESDSIWIAKTVLLETRWVRIRRGYNRDAQIRDRGRIIPICMSVSVGTRLGPYEVLARIGEGGMGEVWK